MGFAKQMPYYTAEDYLQWGGKWELINGNRYPITHVPSSEHQVAHVKVVAALSHLLARNRNCRILAFPEWQLRHDTIVQPDVALVDQPGAGRLLTLTPRLVVELMLPASEQTDRLVKFALYREAGVRYYVLADLAKEVAEVYTLQDEGYELLRSVSRKTVTFSLPEGRFNVDFATIWP